MTGAAIIDGQVGTLDLANGSVTADKVAKGAIGGDRIAPGSIGASLVAAGAVTAPAIAAGAVTGGAIADGSIGTVDLAPETVASATIRDGAVTGSKIGVGAVTADKLAPGTIGILSLTDGQVTTAKLADDSVTSAKVVADSLVAADLAPGSVGASEIANETITSDEIAVDSIDATRIGAGAVGTQELVDAGIATVDIAPLAVTGAKLATDAVTTGKITDDTIVAADLSAGSVGTSELVNAEVTTGKLAPNAVTPAKIAPAATDGQVLATVGGAATWVDPTYPGNRTIVVKAGGTDAQNGARLVAANAQVGASPEEWLLVLEPGTYDLGITPLALNPGVNLRGAGSDVTTISGATSDAYLVTVSAGTDATISGLEVLTPTVGSSFTGGVLVTAGTGSVTLDDVAFDLTNTVGNAYGILAQSAAQVHVRDSSFLLRSTGPGSVAWGIETVGADVWVSSTRFDVLGVAGATSFSARPDPRPAMFDVRGTQVVSNSYAFFDLGTAGGSRLTISDSAIQGLLAGNPNVTRLISNTVLNVAPEATEPVSCHAVSVLSADQFDPPLDNDCA